MVATSTAPAPIVAAALTCAPFVGPERSVAIATQCYNQGCDTMSPMSAQPLNRVSTVDALAGALRTQILNGELSPGAQLREVELASAFGVGRYSLRAAMQTLVHEGLLRHEPNRGVFVPQ